MPQRAAKAAARSRSREATATTAWRVLRRSDPTKRSAIHPGPSTPQRSGGATIGSGVRGGGSVDGGDMGLVELGRPGPGAGEGGPQEVDRVRVEAAQEAGPDQVVGPGEAGEKGGQAPGGGRGGRGGGGGAAGVEAVGSPRPWPPASSSRQPPAFQGQTWSSTRSSTWPATPAGQGRAERAADRSTSRSIQCQRSVRRAKRSCRAYKAPGSGSGPPQAPTPLMEA